MLVVRAEARNANNITNRDCNNMHIVILCASLSAARILDDINIGHDININLIITKKKYIFPSINPPILHARDIRQATFPSEERGDLAQK